jgi:hypothetical protein
MICADSPTTVLLASLPEWPAVTMLPGLDQSDAQDLLRHWILIVVVLPALFLDMLRQASPGIFPISASPGSWYISHVSYVLGKGVLPPLQTLPPFQPVGTSTVVDQLRLCSS